MNRSVTAAAWSERFFVERFVSAEIRSAGTHAHDGHPAAASTIEAMFDHGFDLRSHQTARVTGEALHWADSVVVMEPMHRDVLLDFASEHVDKIVPMWPFVGDGTGAWVNDPHGGPIGGYRLMAVEIGEASKKLVEELLERRRRHRNKG